MRQPTDPEIIQRLVVYHGELKGMFAKGKLKGKIVLMMKAECKRVGISWKTFYNKRIGNKREQSGKE